jgi:16S rRNA (guanine(966)-N(2))-methyltransferase RsmD
MRVIAGSLKGRRLTTPTWDGLRPTSDKLRETLFNILAPQIAGALFVDAYAGTGAVGIEALSRGAREVIFVERDRRAQALIAENLAHCGIATGYTVLRTDARRAFTSVAPGTSGWFDIVFLDPPYAAIASEILETLEAAGERLAPNGSVVLEHGRRQEPPVVAGRLVRTRAVISGDSVLTFYEVGSRKPEF